MQIFILDTKPKTAAIMLCDKHVIKQILESAQILCTSSNLKNTPYKPTHQHHPCTIWAGKSMGNWNWLLAHLSALLKEYTFRYDKIHKTSEIETWLKNNTPKIPIQKQTSFVQAIPDIYKSENHVTAYRNYYIKEKAWAKWNKTRPAPFWWIKDN